MNPDTNAARSGSEPTEEPTEAKACPYCGAELTTEAPYCWKCGKAQPGVFEYAEADPPRDERALSSQHVRPAANPEANLERDPLIRAPWPLLLPPISGEAEAEAAMGIILVVGAFVLLVFVFYTVRYLLGAWGLTLPGDDEMPDTDSWREVAITVGRPYVIGTLTVLFIFALADFIIEMRGKNRVNAILATITGVGLLVLILSVVINIPYSFGRPLGLAAVGAASIVLVGSKIGRRIYGAVRRR
jgi:hypothetical protein